MTDELDELEKLGKEKGWIEGFPPPWDDAFDPKQWTAPRHVHCEYNTVLLHGAMKERIRELEHLLAWAYCAAQIDVETPTGPEANCWDEYLADWDGEKGRAEEIAKRVVETLPPCARCGDKRKSPKNSFCEDCYPLR